MGNDRTKNKKSSKNKCKISHLLFAIMLVFTFKVHALNINLYPISGDYRYKENTEGAYQVAEFKNLAFSISFAENQLLFEHVEFENRTGNPTLFFNETTQEYHLNYLYQVSRFSSYLSLYMGLGTGVYTSEVTTTYINQEISDKTGNIMFLSGLISLQATYKFLATQLDLRLMEAKDYRPQPTPGLILRAGFSF